MGTKKEYNVKILGLERVISKVIVSLKGLFSQRRIISGLLLYHWCTDSWFTKMVDVEILLIFYIDFVHFREDIENFIMELYFFTTMYPLYLFLLVHYQSIFIQMPEPFIQNKRRYQQLDFSSVKCTALHH